MLEKIKEASSFIQSKSSIQPKVGVILGSGLGGFAEQMNISLSIDYSEIPNFPVSTVEGHAGKLLLGEIEGVPVLALQGRFHYYEGYNLKKASFPIHVMKEMGINDVLLSNASGGLDPNQKIGDLMVITDHLHLFPDNPLRGKNDDRLGPRFPDMSKPYCPDLIEIAKKVAKAEEIELKFGVYAGTPGPTYETKAEYKAFRICGADAVGMSTTPETIVAIYRGMRVFGVSIISDLGVEGQIVEISHEEVQEVAAEAAPKLAQLIKKMIPIIRNQQSTTN